MTRKLSVPWNSEAEFRSVTIENRWINGQNYWLVSSGICISDFYRVASMNKYSNRHCQTLTHSPHDQCRRVHHNRSTNTRKNSVVNKWCLVRPAVDERMKWDGWRVTLCIGATYGRWLIAGMKFRGICLRCLPTQTIIIIIMEMSSVSVWSRRVAVHVHRVGRVVRPQFRCVKHETPFKYFRPYKLRIKSLLPAVWQTRARAIFGWAVGTRVPQTACVSNRWFIYFLCLFGFFCPATGQPWQLYHSYRAVTVCSWYGHYIWLDSMSLRHER